MVETGAVSTVDAEAARQHPGGTPSISLIPPKALVVVDVAELAPVATLPPRNQSSMLCSAYPPGGTPSISLIPPTSQSAGPSSRQESGTY